MIQDIDIKDLREGDDITVWTGSSGQGGLLWAIPDQTITITAPGNRLFEYPLRKVTHITVDRPGPATDCLEYGPECQGPVEMRWPGSGHRQWPRCQYHGDRRLANVSELERYADSDVAPPGFREDDAGERWADD